MPVLETCKVSGVWEVWAIKHLPSGQYLPMRWKKNRGFSHDVPEYGFPRLFRSERSARAALRAWLAGTWSKDWTQVDGTSFGRDYEDGSPEPTHVSGRVAEEMKVVRITVEWP